MDAILGVCVGGGDVVVSLHRGPKFKPQKDNIVLIIKNPQNGTLLLGNLCMKAYIRDVEEIQGFSFRQLQGAGFGLMRI